jgi:hypothetical protein
MSTIIVTIGGAPTPGDLLMLSYSSPTRGGVSCLKYKVRQPVDAIVEDPATGAKSVQTRGDTLESIVDGFIDEFNKGQEWPLPEFQFRKRNATQFVVTQNNLTDSSFFVGIEFKPAIEGAGGAAPTETMELEVF